MTTTRFDSDNLTSDTKDKVNASAWSSISNENVLGINDKSINTSIELSTEPVSGTSLPHIDSYAKSSLPSSEISLSSVTGQNINSTSSNWTLSSSRTAISGTSVGETFNISIESMMSSGTSVSRSDASSKNVNTSRISPDASVSSTAGEDFNNNSLNTTMISGGTSMSNISGQDTSNTSWKSMLISWNASSAASMSGMNIEDIKNVYANSSLILNSTSISGAFVHDFSNISTNSSVSASRRPFSAATAGSGAVVDDVTISGDISLVSRGTPTSSTTAQDINEISADSSLSSSSGTLLASTGARDTSDLSFDRIVDGSFESSKAVNDNTISFISNVGVSEAYFPSGGVSSLDGSFSGIDSLNGLMTGISPVDGEIGAGIASLDDVFPGSSFVLARGVGGKRSFTLGPKDMSKATGNILSNNSFVAFN